MLGESDTTVSFVWWVFRYLQKVARSPLYLSQNVVMAQVNVTQPAASFQSWTLEVGGPEDESSWLDS